MGSKALPLRDADIFHNLPTFPSDVKGLTAIVTGANGISGFGTMRVLLESPNRWTKIYALSRRPPPPEMMDLLPKEAQNRIEHVASDFLSKPEDIAKAIKDNHVTADVVFFYSYLQPKPREGAPVWSNAEELVETNGAPSLTSSNREGLPRGSPSRADIIQPVSFAISFRRWI